MVAQRASFGGARTRTTWGIASRMALVEECYQDTDLCKGGVGRTA